jgi:hypothetical protein
MHLLVLMILAAAVTGASPQTSTPHANPPPSSDQSSPTDLSAHQQHIGSTGPLDTTSGGAPAESPQGQSPPGMQAAPEGSSKVITNGK